MKKTIAHFGVHNAADNMAVAVNANAGDTLLFEATRTLFQKFLGPVEWKLEALWQEVTPEKVHELNTKRDAALIGGGGLFLRDQSGANTALSGWQWNCSEERIKDIDIPLILFGVGYNRFRGQEDFEPIFAQHIRAVLEKSTFFGLRNHGSRYAIRRYLPPSLHHRVQYQPCPTTVLRYLHEDVLKPIDPDHKTLVLNAAFDRREMRMGTRGVGILEDIADVMATCAGEGWNILLANHKPQDAEIGAVLEKKGVRFDSADLAQAYPQDILEFYSDKRLVVGMRGHAQMIPFGLGRPIVSIISHDKMGWFLDDIGHPEWGIDVEDPAFGTKLHSAIQSVAQDASISEKLSLASERLWTVTCGNMEKIKETLS